MRIRPFPLLLAAAAALAARPSAAQTVEGVLLAQDGQTPLAGARVALVGLGARVAAEGRTDSTGRFTLTAPAAGLYRVRAEPQGGAAMLFAPLTLAAGERKALEFEMQPPTAGDTTYALAPVTAVAEARRPVLDRNGFYQRQHFYHGRFLTREQFLALHGFRLTEKIQDLGILLEPHGSGRFRPYRPARMAGSQGSGRDPLAMRNRSASSQRCYVAMYIDGAPVNDLSLLQLTNDMVAGVEYYTRDDIPPEWNPYKGDPNWRCGSLVIWTQPPEPSPAPTP